MGYQFIHVECYARTPGKGKQGGHSIRSILAEAGREPGACPHVPTTTPPSVVYGCSLAELEKGANDYAEQAKDSIGRKLRTDAPVLLAGVVSAPDAFTPEQWQDLKTLTVRALRGRYGDRLKTVIEHTDEAKRHMHFYAVPLPGERFDQLHTGRGAKASAEAEAKAQGLPKSQITKAGNLAYTEEMRAYQRWFHDEVGSRLGLTLFGPQRRRLSRGEWKAEQEAAQAIAKARQEAEQKVREASVATRAAELVQASARETVKVLEQAKASSLEAKASAEHKQREALELAQKLEAKRAKLSQAHKVLVTERASLQREKAAWQKVGDRLGSTLGWIWDAITGRSRKLKRELEEQRQEAEARAAEQKRAAAIEKQLAVEQAVARIKQQRDSLAQDVSHLRAKVQEQERREKLEAHFASKRSASSPRLG